MPYKEEQPTLIGCLAWIPLKLVVKKGAFGKRYLHLFDYFQAIQFQYESGAVLGRAKRDKLSALKKLLVIPGYTAADVMEMAQDTAKKRLTDFKKDSGNEPETFSDFLYWKMFESAIGQSITDCAEAYLHGNKKILKMIDKKANEKVPLPEADYPLSIFGYEGVGFGSSFPELTEKMYRNATENIDMDKWSKARAYGLAIPEKPDIVSLEEREEALLQIVAAYTAEFYPELLDPLDLRGYIDTEGNR